MQYKNMLNGMLLNIYIVLILIITICHLDING